ncbi:MAG: hypothetical protein ACKVWR_07690 [Acidimicrobiales bacterium]
MSRWVWRFLVGRHAGVLQDRYAGDVGDFLKFGLLRWLHAPVDGAEPLRVGVVWYLTVDEDHNADGKHVAYLDAGDAVGRRLQALDPDLHRRLGGVVKQGRSVAALEAAGVLPGAVWFSRRLDLSGAASGDRAGRLARRRAWLAEAHDAMVGAELVFVDPDNGLRPADHPAGRHLTKAVKHAYLDELAGYVDRGQSLLAYHHADRSAPVVVQAQRRLVELRDALGVEPLAAVQASSGSVRLFLLVPAPAHRERLAARLDALAARGWAAPLRAGRSGPLVVLRPESEPPP